MKESNEFTSRAEMAILIKLAFKKQKKENKIVDVV
jgi:hypothetical protein